jgi:DNA topoisomerase-2
MDNRPVEKIYQKKTQLEHILLRPDTYIGSTEPQIEKLWVYDRESKSLQFREITYVPGLYKIFDEILVNAADNFQRDKKMNFIKVNINQKENRITVKNNGCGIPITIHKEYNIYVPELIFGNLLTSSNYDDTSKKVVGGRNGFGAKLTNIFSKVFIVETADKKVSKNYKQVFKNNMSSKGLPEINDFKKGDEYTSITFEPDLKQFHMQSLDDDIVSLMIKRVYDMAGITNTKVKVYLDDEVIEIKNFFEYIDMYLDTHSKAEEKDIPKVYESPNERWEIGVSLSEGQFQQVSYVNAIATTKGGTHVNYVTEKITDHIQEILKKKNKKLTIKPHQIRQHLWIFVNCLIDNPTFDGQTKENMTLKSSAFGSSFDFSEKFLKEVVKTGIVEHCLSYAKTREDLKLNKQLNAGIKKTGRLYGIPKLEDANKAGTKNSDQCILILTEGDSAKSLAMSGIEVVGRDHYGVFPLKGKLLNVREASNASILKNDELQNIMKIIGLQTTKKYEDVKSLRYGSIMIMTDQDHDGSHIKGLIINFIHNFWPSLIKLNGFLKEFITPIIKVTKNSVVKSFYTIPDYKKWAEEQGGNLKSWKIKYYKGLGTSTDKEAQEYFSEIERNRIIFLYNNQVDDEAIDMAFNKKKAEERKIWLENYNPQRDILDTGSKQIIYRDFINKELILFSMSSNVRSIPSICDGLKPSERKVLFGCFKRKLKDEIKVAQLVGYVSEHSAYHHGEMSLSGTIVAMGQNFVGSNNINLLMPLGQFGTRNQGGKDHASSRYIFTSLNKVTRHIFNPNDDPLMDNIIEEGQKIEPNWYLPILPMCLVNGAEGIGTGWSTSVPCYNPRELCENIKYRIKENKYFEMKPWYKGFTGGIERNDDEEKNSYIISGKYEWIGEKTVKIFEIPIKIWTKNYKEHLEKLMGIEHKKEKDKKSKKKDESDEEKKEKITPIIQDFKEYHTNNKVDFEVNFLDEYADKYREDDVLFQKKFKLISSLNLTNMVMFNSKGQLRRYNNVEEIIEEFFILRLEYYQKRKDYIIANLTKELIILENKVRFILAVTADKPELKINKRKKKEILSDLIKQSKLNFFK